MELPKIKEPEAELAQADLELTPGFLKPVTPRDEEMFREFKEIQLALDDPLAYENAQIEGDLEIGAGSERAEDSGSEFDVFGGGGS